MQHAWLWRLRCDVEPHAAGKVEPGRSHQVRILQKDAGISVHGLRERSVVVVPAELFSASSIILLSGGARVASFDPGSPLGAVVALVDLLKVVKACSLLLEVGEHAREDLGAVCGVLADGGVLADRAQEVGVGVGGILPREELVEFGLWENTFDILDI